MDQDVDAGKTYYYQMALVNDGGVGPMSATLEAKAPTFETLFEDNFNGTEINEQWKDQDGIGLPQPRLVKAAGRPMWIGRNTTSIVDPLNGQIMW